MNKNAEYPSMALQAAYNVLMNENSALHKITTDLCYDVLAGSVSVSMQQELTPECPMCILNARCLNAQARVEKT